MGYADTPRQNFPKVKIYREKPLPFQTNGHISYGLLEDSAWLILERNWQVLGVEKPRLSESE